MVIGKLNDLRHLLGILPGRTTAKGDEGYFLIQSME